MYEKPAQSIIRQGKLRKNASPSALTSHLAVVDGGEKSQWLHQKTPSFGVMMRVRGLHGFS